MFTDITDFAKGATDEQTPEANGSVNYFIYEMDGTQHGPFAIQVGGGPLYIQVTAGRCLPDPAVIPVGGSLRMVSSDFDSYNVGWGRAANPFNPSLSTVGMHNATAPAGEYNYSVSGCGPIEGNGGGKVIVTG